MIKTLSSKGRRSTSASGPFALTSIALSAVLVGASAAAAMPVTATFVAQGESLDPNDQIDYSLTFTGDADLIGVFVLGSFEAPRAVIEYDTLAPDLNGLPTLGVYTGAVSNFVSSIGTNAATGTTGDVEKNIAGTHALDLRTTDGVSPTLGGLFEFQTAFVQLVDDDATTFADDSIPLVTPTLADFEIADIVWQYRKTTDGSLAQVRAPITSLALRVPQDPVGSAEVPLPATVLLLGAAVAALGARKGLRRRA